MLIVNQNQKPFSYSLIMSFLRDFVGSFRKKDISEYPLNVVVEVKNDDYKQYQVYAREDCLVLYGLPDVSRFEIVLQKAMPSKGVEVDYSLCRFDNQMAADKVFQAMVQNKFPTLCNNFPDLVNANNLQELVNYIRTNPEQTLAHICAYFGYLDCLKGIIANQPSLKDAVDPITQYTPLHLAVKGCRLPVVQYLVSCGADLSKTDIRGWNIFHFASTTTRDIISALCYPSESNSSTTTASSSSVTSTLTSTLSSSFSSTLSSGSHSTLLSQSSISSSIDDSNTPTNSTNTNNYNNLNNTNSNGNNLSDRRKLIIKLINARNNETNSPLYLACAADKPECIKELLKNGADVNGASLETIENEKTRDHSLCNVIEQLDPKVMKMGGTALHWAKSPQCMEALIEMGCNINAKNFQGETVFHCMVAKKNLSCIVTLLSHGADVNATGPNGETPLHIAVRTGEVTIVQALVVFGADLNTCNNSGETPRHIIATNKRIPNQELILYTLESVGAKRCKKAHNLSCTDGCALNATFNGIPPETSPLSRIVSIHDVHYYRDILEEAVKRKKEKEMKINFDEPPENEIKLLCLDGGGIKGLILVQMLAILEDMTKRRICETFNWIAGTSTGGILAISLALGNTAAECRQLYFRLKDKVFLGPRPYDSEPLEKFVQKEFGIDTKISEITHPRLMITATIADRFPADLFLFRNYPSADEIISSESNSSRSSSPTGSDHLLWKVARSSGAAPTYFRPCGSYLDGGLISNNPTLDALTEISQINASYAHTGCPERKLKPAVVVSCGTGAIPVKQISIVDVCRPDSLFGVAKMAVMASALGELLVDQATQSDGQVVKRSKAWCHGIHLPYFRLNPPISENISLDETNNAKLINMLWETSVYMHKCKDELQELIYLLS